VYIYLIFIIFNSNRCICLM